MKADRDADGERLGAIKQQQFALVSYQLNGEMSRFNDAIYEGSYNAPVLDFTDSNYIFFLLMILAPYKTLIILVPVERKNIQRAISKVYIRDKRG